MKSLLAGLVWVGLLIQVPNAHAQFDASDLEGAWHVYTRWDSPLAHEAGWETLIGLVVGPTGTIPNGGGSLNSSVPFESDSVAGGSLAVTPAGRFGGTVEFAIGPDETVEEFQLGVGSTATPMATPPSDLFVGVVTDSESFVNLSVGVRQMQSGFDIGDITGGVIWSFISHWDLPESGGNDPGWDRGRFRFRPTTGNRAAIDDTQGIDSEGLPLELDDLEVAVQVDGRVTLLPIVGEFRMGRDKNWMAGTSIDPDGYRSISVLMRGAVGLSQQDLEGTWTWFRFFDDVVVNAPGWSRGVFQVDATGAIIRGIKESSNGVSDWVDGGNLLVGPGGVDVSGTIEYANTPDEFFVEAEVSAGHNLLAGVASAGTQRGLTIALPVPEPSAGIGLGFTALLAIAARRDRRAAHSSNRRLG